MLDIGTGLGRYARWFASHGFEATGIDRYADGLKQAAALPNGDRVTFLHRDIADLAELGFREHSFGLIMDRNSSQFLKAERQPRYFDTVAALLAPKGIFYYGIVEPSGPSPPPLAQKIGLSAQEALDLIEQRFEIIKQFERPSANLPDMQGVEVVAKPRG